MNVTPRDASTVCLVRDGAGGMEVLMVRRTPAARFMGGAWVFPGGAVDEMDGEAAGMDRFVDRWRAAALRELVEETGIWLLESGPVATTDRPYGSEVFAEVEARGDRFDGRGLRYFARWITPAPLPIRFDARFFVVPIPFGVDPIIDGDELVDARWIRPVDAVDRASDGRWVVAFPTLKTVEFFSTFASTDVVMDHVGAMDAVHPIQPRLSVAGDRIEILIPGDGGFDAAEEAEKDPDLMNGIARIVATGGDVPPDFRPT